MPEALSMETTTRLQPFLSAALTAPDVRQFRTRCPEPFANALLRLQCGDISRLDGYFQRFLDLMKLFETSCPSKRLEGIISCPGRLEYITNHLDHQGFRVIGGPVNRDNLGGYSKRTDGVIEITSRAAGNKGPGEKYRIELSDLELKGTDHPSVKLIKGALKYLKDKGVSLGTGFDLVVDSEVKQGSGISSSACFSMLTLKTLQKIYKPIGMDNATMVLAAQYGENKYWGKPSGILDQWSIASHGPALIDPKTNSTTTINVPWGKLGLSVVMIQTESSHATDNSTYASIPRDMCLVAEILGGKVLSEVAFSHFVASIPRLRREGVPDQAILRAMHAFEENQRGEQFVHALREGDGEQVCQLIQESGTSSFELLGNAVDPNSTRSQPLGFALGVFQLYRDLAHESDKFGFRLHGGGFQGTAVAWVSSNRASECRDFVNGCYGTECASVLGLRDVGVIDLEELVNLDGAAAY